MPPYHTLQHLALSTITQTSLLPPRAQTYPEPPSTSYCFPEPPGTTPTITQCHPMSSRPRTTQHPPNITQNNPASSRQHYAVSLNVIQPQNHSASTQCHPEQSNIIRTALRSVTQNLPVLPSTTQSVTTISQCRLLRFNKFIFTLIYNMLLFINILYYLWLSCSIFWCLQLGA